MRVVCSRYGLLCLVLAERISCLSVQPDGHVEGWMGQTTEIQWRNQGRADVGDMMRRTNRLLLTIKTRDALHDRKRTSGDTKMRGEAPEVLQYAFRSPSGPMLSRTIPMITEASSHNSSAFYQDMAVQSSLHYTYSGHQSGPISRRNLYLVEPALRQANRSKRSLEHEGLQRAVRGDAVTKPEPCNNASSEHHHRCCRHLF